MALSGRLWRPAGWYVLPAATALFALAALGPLVARSPLMLGVTLLFVGAGSGALDVAMNAAISDVEAIAGPAADVRRPRAVLSGRIPRQPADWFRS